jgi:hypothetical protein
MLLQDCTDTGNFPPYLAQPDGAAQLPRNMLKTKVKAFLEKLFEPALHLFQSHFS